MKPSVPEPVASGDPKALLDYLTEHGPTPFHDIAEALVFTEHRLFQAERNLVRRGLVAEEPGENGATLKLTEMT